MQSMTDSLNPHHSDSSDNSGDKFYTKPDIAEYCIQKIDSITDYPHIVEPSAGSGIFLRYLPEHTEAYDVEPCDAQRHRITEQSWFHTTGDYSGGLLVGNPPFGRRSVLAKDFIRHGIRLGFTTIAFILPKTFKKYSLQAVFPAHWRLIHTEDLPDNSFTYQDEDYHVPCVFQIWQKTDDIGLFSVNASTDFTDLREKKHPAPTDFRFLSRGDDTADFCIIGTSGRVIDAGEVTNQKGTHFIRVTDREQVEHIRRHFENIVYDMHSSVSGGVAWLSQNDIIGAYEEHRSTHERHRTA